MKWDPLNRTSTAGTVREVDLLCSLDFVQFRAAPLLLRCVTSSITGTPDAARQLSADQVGCGGEI